MNHRSSQGYLAQLKTQAELPKGFTVKTHTIRFEPPERATPKQYRMNLALVRTVPTQRYASVMSQNRLPGASILLARKRLSAGGLQALLLNNCIANTLTATAYEDACNLTKEISAVIGAEEDEVLSVSTGIIGWKLPLREISAALPALAGAAPADGLDLAQAIMTTDRYPKLVRHVFPNGGSILAVAKGAGMVEPNMATMLSFMLTDVQIEKEDLDRLLPSVVDESFHAMTIDSDSSTNDMVLVLSSGLGPKVSVAEFDRAMRELSATLVEQIVRNGEGVGHVISYDVRGMSSAEEARALGKTVANSPLVKSAIAGNDPNIGRLLMAVGKYLGRSSLDMQKLVVTLGPIEVFSKGYISLDAQKEKALSAYLRDTQYDTRATFPVSDHLVEITIDFQQGGGAARVLGGDLTKEYIQINAEYRT